jgi:hypothetical protein
MCDNPPFTKIVPTSNDTTTEFSYDNSVKISAGDISFSIPSIDLSDSVGYSYPYPCGHWYDPKTCHRKVSTNVNLGNFNVSDFGLPNPMDISNQEITVYPTVNFELTTNPTYWYNLYKLQEIINSDQVQLSEYEYYFNYFFTSQSVFDESSILTNDKDVIVVGEKKITNTNVLLTSANQRYQLFVNSNDGAVGIRDVQTNESLPLGGVYRNNFPGASTNFSVRLTNGNLQIFQTFFDYTIASEATYLLWESNSSGEASSSYFALFNDEGILMVCKGTAPSTIESVLWNSQGKNTNFEANAELKTKQEGTTINYYIRLRFGMNYSFKKGTTFTIEGVQNIFNCKEDITVQIGEPYDTGNLDDSSVFGAITQLLNGSEEPNTLYIIAHKPVPVSQLAITKFETNVVYSADVPILNRINIAHNFIFDTQNTYFTSNSTTSADFNLALVLEVGISSSIVNLNAGSIHLDSKDVGITIHNVPIVGSVKETISINPGSANVDVNAECNPITVNACMDPEFNLVIDVLFGNTLSFSFVNNAESTETMGTLTVSGKIKNPYHLSINGGYKFSAKLSGSILGNNFGETSSESNMILDHILQNGTEIIDINKTMTVEKDAS